MKNNRKQKGFTLIELLVVIAIIAVLAVVVVLTLNPAELLRQARDSNRVSDFATLKSAIGLYSADVTTTTLLCGTTSCTATNIFLSGSSSVPVATFIAASTTSAGWGFTGESTTSTGSRAITGYNIGWLPINFTAISSGAPIGSLPVDPVNNNANSYAYVGSGTTYKLATKMESLKYSNGGTGDVETNDGGNSTTTYEQGTNLAL